MKTEDLKFKHEVAEAIKKIFELGKQKETNPVTKVQEIVKTLTDDVRLQNKLLEILTHNLTIEQINKLYLEGNTVIYWTARGGVTGIDWYDLTKRQLDLWGAKYHDLRMGKPHYDYFICDKVINADDYFK